MTRRNFLSLLAGAVVWPLAARAQSGRIPHIGILIGSSESDPAAQTWMAHFKKGLEELGWQPGRNVALDFYWGNGVEARLREQAEALAKHPPDVIFSVGTASTSVIRQATSTVPVVFAVVNDPVAQGYVSSMAKPGGNITGFSLMDYSVLGKSMEFLRQVAPSVTRIALLFNPDTYPYYETYLKSPSTPLPITGLHVRSAAEIELKIAKIEPGTGLLVAPDTFNSVNRKTIIQRAAEHRIPATYPYSLFVKDGGLMAYGPNPADVVQRSAAYVDRILKGDKPADLPIQAPTKIELTINVKTAKALGLAVPSSLLFTADEVVE